jgi:sugar (Glycoside-Pentoside-Hexuronide) transporter
MFEKFNKKLITQDLTFKELFAYGMGMFACGAGGIGAGTYLTFFWSDIAMVPLASIGIIMLISRIFDGTDDIIVGWLIDRTQTKYGKARPWILKTFIPATITLVALFYVPDFGNIGKIIWAFGTYNLSKLFFSTFCMLPMQSLTSLMTANPKGRMTLSLTSQIAMALATVLGSIFVIKGIAYLGGGKSGYFCFFGIIAVLTGVGYLIAFLGTKEKVVEIKKQKDKISLKEAYKSFAVNKWWCIATLFQFFTFLMYSFSAINMYYMTYIMKNVDLMATFMVIQSIVQFVAPFLIGPMINRIGGKINANLVGVALIIIGGFLPVINTPSVVLLMISSLFRGLGIGFIFSTRFAIMADIADYGEHITGRRTDALVYSGISMSTKLGMGISAVLLTYFLKIGGYVGGFATQPPSALAMITFMFTWLTVIIAGLMGICAFTLKGLENAMPKVRTELELRRLMQINDTI